MKKHYVNPLIELFSMDHAENMLSNSDNGREAGSGPTTDGLPIPIGETDDETDPYGGHGQGDGGGGNRGKEFDLWDIESFDVWN